MAVYVYDPVSGRMVDKKTGERMVPDDAPLAAPRVEGDYEGYQSPIDGSWIEGRRARRYDMEKNNCVDGRQFAPKKIKNPRFAKKWGLQHLLEQ